MLPRQPRSLASVSQHYVLKRFHLVLFENLLKESCCIFDAEDAIALCMKNRVNSLSALRDLLEKRNHTDLGIHATVHKAMLEMTKGPKMGVVHRDPSGLIVHKESKEKTTFIMWKRTWGEGEGIVWNGQLAFAQRNPLFAANPPPLSNQVETLKTYVGADAESEFKWDLLEIAWNQIHHPPSWLHNVQFCGGANKGEMYFQQFVYPPFATAMLAAAGPKWLQYCADQDVVGSLHVELNNDPNSFYVVYAKPDAALLGPSGDPLGLMEIKEWDSSVLLGEPDRGDLAKCILWSSVTALRLSKTAQTDGQPEIPFILGRGFYVYLFTTKLNNGGVPEITYLHEAADMRVQADVRSVFADFVHLLGIVCKTARGHVRALASTRKTQGTTVVKNIFSASKSTKRKSDHDPSLSQGKRSSQTRGNDGDGQDASFSETKAMDAVLRVFDNPRATIRYPWPRYRNIFDSDDADWRYYQQKSPFFFRGEWEGETEVFFKVWREDDGTSEDDLETEISLLRRAGAFGISVPVVLDKFTRKVCVGDSTFQVLGMTHVGDTHHVSNGEELIHYALLLIEHILQLHEGGILHCDLKPDNIVWDPKSKTLTVVDFGHAQELQNAVCYHGTKGFEAPELLTGDANSRASDAYSVGVTLMKQIEHCSTAGISTPGVVHTVVEGLMSGRKESRMTLPVALGLVRDYRRSQVQGVIQADRKRPWEGTGEYNEPRIQLLATQ